MRRPLILRLASHDGFTMVELLVAAIVLIVGVLTAFTALDSSRRLTLVAERRTTIQHHAQLELERVKSLPYSQIALTSDSSQWSSTSTDYTFVNDPAGSCPDTSSGPVPTYQPDHSGGSSATESLVINGCTYTINGSTQSLSGGTVAPVTNWSAGGLSGHVYDFVTWSSDPTCSQTSTPGSICPTTNDYKRITIVVTLDGASQPSKPAIVSDFVVDPDAIPPGAPSNSAQNPLTNPKTSCVDSNGDTVSCSNTLTGTPIQYFLTDTAYTNTYGNPSCSGNTEHPTLINSLLSGLLSPPKPDQLVTGLPSGSCTDGSGNPTPPCFATDIGCNGGGGLPFVPSGSSTCGSPPTDNTKSHSWVAPTVPVGSTLNLSGAGSITTYLESGNGVAANATICLGLYIVPGGVLGVLTGNLLAHPIGAAVSANVSVAAGTPTPVSFDFNVGQAAAISSTVLNIARVEVVLWVAASAGTQVDLAYDQAQLASQLTLITTT